MVTNEFEGGKLKCHRYWPDPTSTPPTTRQQYGPIIVEYVSLAQFPNYSVRKFNISDGSSTRELIHFYYHSWPDHGVPLTTNELLIFRSAVKSAVIDPDTPILIHCSAGVGRTGTFIAIDQLVEQCLELHGVPDIDECVREMRMCRNHMVQTEMQYVFIYRAILDALSELLEDESTKSQRIAAAAEAEKEYQKQLEAAAELIAAEKRAEEERERQAAEAARIEYLTRTGSSADNARLLVKGTTLKDRIMALRNAEKSFMDNYKKSLEEWNERNKVSATLQCCSI